MNTIVLGLDKYPSNEKYDQILEYINFFFSFIFFVEMILKLIGLGFS